MGHLSPPLSAAAPRNGSNNDDDVLGGMKEEIYSAIQNIFLGADVAEEMARLDQLWDEAAAALDQ